MRLWQGVRAVVLDMDGVIFIGNSLRRGVPEFIAHLEREGTPYHILTNRSIYTPARITARLASMGLVVDPGHITTASEVVATHLSGQPGMAGVFTLGGEEGLAVALQAHAIEQTRLESLSDAEVQRLALAGAAVARPLVIGWTQTYDYDMATRVHRLSPCISSLFSTGADRSFADENGSMAGIVWVTGSVEALLRKPVTNPAKPSPYALEVVLHKLGCPAEETVVIGDSPTDVEIGNSAGCRTILVLGGATDRHHAAALRGGSAPQLVIEELSDLLP